MHVEFGITGIRRTVIPAMDRASNRLTGANNALMSLNIPSNYPRGQREALLHLSARIRQTNTNVTNVATWLERTTQGMVNVGNSNSTNNQGSSYTNSDVTTADDYSATTSAVKELVLKESDSNWIQRVGATAGNILIGMAESSLNSKEFLVDTAAYIGTTVVSIPTLIWDYGIVGGWNAIFNGGYQAGNATQSMWDGIKSFTSTNYTSDLMFRLYETSFGRWLDRHAYEPFKSTSQYRTILGLAELGWNAVSGAISDALTKDNRQFDVNEISYLQDISEQSRIELQDKLDTNREWLQTLELIYADTVEEIKKYERLYRAYALLYNGQYPGGEDAFIENYGSQLSELEISSFYEMQSWMNEREDIMNYIKFMIEETNKIILELPYDYIMENADFERLSDFSHYADIHFNVESIRLPSGEMLSGNNINPLAASLVWKEQWADKIRSEPPPYLIYLQYLQYIDFMTDEQIQIYNYLFAKEGRASADRYFDAIKDQLHQAIGFYEAETFLRSLDGRSNFTAFWLTFLEGTDDGVLNFFQGIENFFSPDGVRSAQDYKQMFIMQALSSELLNVETLAAMEDGKILEALNAIEVGEFTEDLRIAYIQEKGITEADLDRIIAENPDMKVQILEEAFKILCREKGFDDSIIAREMANNPELRAQIEAFGGYEKFLANVYKFGITFGNMVPVIIVGLLTKGAGFKVLAKFAGPTLLGLSVAGNETNMAMADGADWMHARIYGMLMGASEATLQVLLGNIPGLNPQAAFSIRGLLSEGLEEALQEVIGSILSSVILGEEFYIDQAQLSEAFIMGILMSGLLTGGPAVINIGRGRVLNVSQDRMANIKARINDGYSPLAAFKAEFGIETVSQSQIDFVSSVDYVLQMIDAKYGAGYGMRVLQAITDPNDVNYGNFGTVTRDGNARNVLMQYSLNDIQGYIQMQTAIDSAIINMDAKYGAGYGMRVLQAIIDPNNVDYGNFGAITRDGGARAALSQYTIEQLTPYIERMGKLSFAPLNINLDLNKLIDARFDTLSNDQPGQYGVDQGALKKLFWFENGRKKGGLEYFAIKEMLENKYNMSKNDASRVISGLDSIGACSYAAVANVIVAKYMNNPAEFRRDFGFNLFIYDSSTGVTSINSAMLLTDIYMFINSVDGGGSLFYTDANGATVIAPGAISPNLDIYGRNLMDASGQQYLSGSYGIKYDLVARYLSSKNPSLQYQTNKLFDYHGNNATLITTQQMQNIIDDVELMIENGNQVTMGVYSSGNKIRFISQTDASLSTSTQTWNEGGGHAVFVTGLTQEGFIVSSWGDKYVIPFADLQNSGSFIINYSILSGIT